MLVNSWQLVTKQNCRNAGKNLWSDKTETREIVVNNDGTEKE